MKLVLGGLHLVGVLEGVWPKEAEKSKHILIYWITKVRLGND
jgi:hypothetical protein